MSGFWKFTNSYASKVSKILEKDDFSLEELLDERETVPELLASNAKLVEYLRLPEVLQKLVDYVVEDDEFQKEEIQEHEKKMGKQEELEQELKSNEEEVEREADDEEEDEEDELAQTENSIADRDITAQDKETETFQALDLLDGEAADSDSDSDSDDSSSSSSDGESDLDSNDNYPKAFRDIDDDGDDEGTSKVKDLGDDEPAMDEELTEAEEEKDEEKETDAERHTRRAQVAAEILSVDVWSLTDTFMENTKLIRKLWGILDKEPPLPIFSATYFMKINEHLLDMKTPEMIQFILQEPNIVQRFMRHIDTPPLMDFLLKVISTDKPDSSTGIIELLKDQNLIPSLISFLGSDFPSSVQSSAGDFLKAFITISANNAESTTIGPNELTRQLVGEPMVKMLVDMMLQGGTGLSNGVGIVIEIIRKNNSDYDPVPVVYVTPESHPPMPRDPIYLGTMVRAFAEAMPMFAKMLQKRIDKVLSTPFGEIEPLGFERFKICELVAELIHCSNMALLNDERGEKIVKERDEIREKLIERHKELMRTADEDSSVSWDEVDISREIENLRLNSIDSDKDDREQNSEQPQDSMDVLSSPPEESSEKGSDLGDIEENSEIGGNLKDERSSSDEEVVDDYDEAEMVLRRNPVVGDQLKIALYDNRIIITVLDMFCRFPWNNFLHNVVFDIVQQILNASIEIGYNRYLAVDLFDRGHITQMIVDGYNRCVGYESETGIRLGYMGHLTLIAEEVVKFVSLNLDSTLKSPIIEEAVSDSKWKYFENEILVDTRNKYNAVLGNEGAADPDTTEEYQDSPNGDNGYFDYSQANMNGDIDDQELDEDQFSRYMSQEMTSDFHDKLESSDDDSEEEETMSQRQQQEQQHPSEKAWRFEGDAHNASDDEGVVDSEIGGKPYHEMEAADVDNDNDNDDDDDDDDDYDNDGEANDSGEAIVDEQSGSDNQVTEELAVSEPSEKVVTDADEVAIARQDAHNGAFATDGDEYEDPNDDGQSYTKANHPLYQADGSLNYPIHSSSIPLSADTPESDIAAPTF